MRYTSEELIHILGEKELDQLIQECRLKRAINPENRRITKAMQDDYGFKYLVAWSIYVLAFPRTVLPYSYVLKERQQNPKR